MTKKNTQLGLSLTEVLLALLVVSIISTASIAAMRLAINGRDQLTLHQEAIQQVENFRVNLQRDLDQFISQSPNDLWRDHNSFTSSQEQNLPAFFAADQTQPLRQYDHNQEAGFVLLSIVTQRFNPNKNQARGNNQYAQYVFDNGTIYRFHRDYVRGTDQSQISREKLLDKIEEFEISFLANGEFNEVNFTKQWSASKLDNMPYAIRIRMKHELYGDIEQLYFVRGNL